MKRKHRLSPLRAAQIREEVLEVVYFGVGLERCINR